MRVNSIYKCLQGEGINVGMPMQLVRLAGCPLRCSYCDTNYAQEMSSGKEMSVDEVVKKVTYPWAMITGGEPLMQEKEVGQLVQALLKRKVKVEVVTSGYYPPPEWNPTTWAVDCKCPSSGMVSKRIVDWKRRLRKSDFVKFVVGTEEDLTFAIENRIGGITSIVSPIIYGVLDVGKIVIAREQAEWNRRVASFCMDYGFRFSLQQHVILYGMGVREV